MTAYRDAHVHVHAHGYELSCVHLAECDSLEECLRRVARAAGTKGPDEWIECVCARPEGWREQRWPTAKELHDAAGGRPCVVRSFDHHSLSASTRALAIAGITRETADIPGGVIERDARGEPAGVLLEKACVPMWDAVPTPSTEDRIEQVRLALADFRARGFVEVHDMLAEAWLGDAIAELVRRGDDDACAMTVWLYAAPEKLDGVLAASARWPKERVRVAGGKLFLDGTINSRTAWMLHDFREAIPEHPRGVAMMTRAEIVEAIRFCDERGLGIAMHAIGDAAVREALDALEEAKPTMVRAPKHDPWRLARVEHCEFIDAADIDRFAAMRVVCSPQPCHLLPDVEALRRYLPHRVDRLLPLDEVIGSMERAGIDPAELVWMGSDAPIVPPSVGDNVQAASMRRREGMREDEALSLGQSIGAERVRSLHRPTAATYQELTN
jgi:predicted amidohydrolase YtcJ